MKTANKLEVVILKPSKYLPTGFVERYRMGFLPNITPYYLSSMTPQCIGETKITTVVIDEYTNPNLDYLNLLCKPSDLDTNRLIAFAGVQSHQFPRAMDLAALAVSRGAMAIIGGPHAMTCDTAEHQGKGVSFSLAEAELVWKQILSDAAEGELQDVYGSQQRWQQDLESFVIQPPPDSVLNRSLIRMHGLYPSRGCVFKCNFCSVIQISGNVVRSQSIEATLASLRLAKKARIKLIVFGSDNFNKYADAKELLQAIIDENLQIDFFAQCDTQIADDEEMVELMARAGCIFMFVGVESFNYATLQAAQKTQNRPGKYVNIIQLCRKYGIVATFSNIIGFPQDTEASVKEHLRIIKELSPAMAWFYILTPIPGTEQYGDFLKEGLITEKNLDRFDCTVPVWTHPNFSHKQLLDLQFGAYQDFYSLRNSIKHVWLNRARGNLTIDQTARMFGFSWLMNMAAARQRHPMSGGIGRRSLDRNEQYSHLRRSTFGYDLFPLPERLALPEIDKTFTRENLAGSLAKLKQRSVK